MISVSTYYNLYSLVGPGCRLEITKGYYGGIGKWPGRQEAPHQGRRPRKINRFKSFIRDFMVQNLNYKAGPLCLGHKREDVETGEDSHGKV